MSQSADVYVKWYRFLIIWNASIRAGRHHDDFEVRQEFNSDLASAMKIAETSFQRYAPAYLAEATVERAQLSVLGDYRFADGRLEQYTRALIGDVIYDHDERTWVADYHLGEDADLQEGLAEQMAWALATARIQTPQDEPEPLGVADAQPS